MIIDFLVYDDGCHLKKFASNPVRSEVTDTTRKLSQMNIVIDKIHFKGHVDPWCKTHCDPHNFPELNGVSGLIYFCVKLILIFRLTLK